MDILDTAESLLPELQLDGNVELLEAGVKVTLQGVGVTQVDGVHLSRVLGGILDVVPEELTKTTELGLTGVLETELEGLQGGGLVHNLETGIVLQNLENRTVGFPQELEPRSHDSAVSAVAGLLTGNGGEQDSLGGFDGFEIFNVRRGSGGLEGRLNLVGLGLSLGDLLFGEFDELLQDGLYYPNQSHSIYIFM